MEHTIEGVKNYSIAVKKHGDTIRFLRKIVPGGIDDSYGIEVAKLAGLPEKVVKRARVLLRQMEQQTAAQNQKPEQSDDMQYNFAAMQQEQAVQMLKKTNLQELSDAECRQVLEEVTNLLRN